jgi:serine/threonine protein kinase
MSESVAMIERPMHNDEDNQPAEPRPGPSPAGSIRFAYPSGSQPLTGYTIKRGLGHGGFGEVYYATSDAGKEVALKLIRRNLEVELRGIRYCLNLKHPNLLTIYDLREDDRGDKWVVMEYIAGQNLEEVIAAHPQGMPREEAMAWLYGIGAGVACLHDHGIVHRDLKPGNIFGDQGLVKIGDYGLSKFISCSRRSGQTESVGTVHYMAPEIANGRYGKEIDIYALGVIAYEMLTGRVPFEGESVGEVLMKHLTAQPDVSLLDEPYRSVIARALDKDPTRRFGSVQELLAALPKPEQPMVSPVQWQTGVSPVQSPPTLPGTEPPPTLPGGTPPAEEAVEAVLVTSLHSDGVSDEEPILKAVRGGWRELRNQWNALRLNRPMKVLLLIIGAMLALHTMGLWLPMTIMLLMVYGGYRVVRAILFLLSPRSTAAAARPPFPPPPPKQPEPATEAGPGLARTDMSRRSHRRWAREMRAERRESAGRAACPVRRPRWALRNTTMPLPYKTPRERAAELFGSMIVGALVAATMCVVAIILGSYRALPPLPQQIAWMVTVAVVGTWAVLIPAKFWEGREGDPMGRRFVMMVIGLALGVVAFAVAMHLSPDEGMPIALPVDSDMSSPQRYNPPSFYQEERPLALAYMAFFGSLFAVLRWWRQADPMRPERLNLRAMVLTLAAAWLLTLLWQFPAKAWLMMTACEISVAVQLASPWIPPQRRLAEQGGAQ